MMVAIILLIGFILRVINLNQTLWLDEAINVVAARNLSLLNLVTIYPKYDFHPPGYFALLWVWIKLFGSSEISVRMPSLIFGVSTIFLVYLIGKKISSKKVGLFAALLLAINPLHIYYSQEARMYSFAAFAVTLNYYFFIKCMNYSAVNYGVSLRASSSGSRINSEKKNWLGYLLSLCLVFTSDYVAYFILPAQFIYLLITRNKNWLHWLKMVLISSVLFILWLPFFLPQFLSGIQTSISIPGWRNVVGSSNFKEVFLVFAKMIIGRISLENKVIYYSLLGILTLLFGWLISRLKNFLLITWLIIPLLFAWLISFIVPVLTYTRLLYLTIPFVLILSERIMSFSDKKKKVFIVLISVIFMLCSLVYLLDTNFHREDWRFLSSFILQENKTVLIENSEVYYPLKYYLKNDNLIKPGLIGVPVDNIKNVIPLNDQSSEVFYLEYLKDVTDPNNLLVNQLINNGYNNVHTYNFRGIGFLHLYKK